MTWLFDQVVTDNCAPIRTVIFLGKLFLGGRI